jgi:hypothetical protein
VPSEATTILGLRVISVTLVGSTSVGMTPVAASSYSTTSMRALAARCRNQSIWQEEAAITSSCSGLSWRGSPFASPVVRTTSCSAGGAVALWARS